MRKFRSVEVVARKAPSGEYLTSVMLPVVSSTLLSTRVPELRVQMCTFPSCHAERKESSSIEDSLQLTIFDQEIVFSFRPRSKQKHFLLRNAKHNLFTYVSKAIFYEMIVKDFLTQIYVQHKKTSSLKPVPEASHP